MCSENSGEMDDGLLTKLLHAAGAGDHAAKEKFADLVVEDLKKIAQHLMRNEGPNSLQPTALVNEAYLRLLDSEQVKNTRNRAYFFAAAAKAMSRVLVDAARKRNATKRGGNRERIPLEHVLSVYEQNRLDVIALDTALEELEQLDVRQCQVVRLRWFLEMSVREVADLLDVSVSTVEQDWRTARAFLKQRMDGSDNAGCDMF